MNICNSHRREGKDVIEGGACRYCMEEEIAWAKAEERARILALVEKVLNLEGQPGHYREGFKAACREIRRRIEEGAEVITEREVEGSIATYDKRLEEAKDDIDRQMRSGGVDHASWSYQMVQREEGA